MHGHLEHADRSEHQRLSQLKAHHQVQDFFEMLSQSQADIAQERQDLP